MNEKVVVMICLESLGIGGVETVVINQTLALIKKGIKVVILAKEGLYKQKIIDIGAKFINWNFSFQNHFDYENVKKLINIIKENNVNHVIINQFPCINDVMFACLLNNTSYTAYIHSTYKAFEDESAEKNIYQYFKNNCKMFSKYFELFFKYASQIITITPISKEYIINKYNVSADKIKVVPNSIELNLFNSKHSANKIEKFLLISRFSEEKIDSIKEALSFFYFIRKEYPDNKYLLKIIGDGNKKEEIASYINELNLGDIIELIGEVSNVKDYIEGCDAVLGVDRCLLEAIAMKRLAIICGYDGLKGFVNKDNIEQCIEENFSGRLLGNISEEELAKFINGISTHDVKKIIEYNYNICIEKLDINKNINIINIDKKECNTISLDDSLKLFDFSTLMLDNERKMLDKLKYENWEINNKYDHVVADKDNIIDQKDYEISSKDNVIKEKQIEIDSLNNKLQNIYSSRSYKIISKIIKRK